VRKKVNIKVRQPLQKILIPVLNPHVQAQIKKVEDIILAEINVKEIEYLTATESFIKKKIKPNFKVLGKKAGAKMKAVAAAIAAFTGSEIEDLERNGQLTLHIENEDLILGLEDVEIVAEDIPGWAVANKGDLTVALDITLTEDLVDEGNAR